MSKSNYDDLTNEGASPARSRRRRLSGLGVALVAVVSMIAIVFMSLAIKSYLDSIQPEAPKDEGPAEPSQTPQAAAGDTQLPEQQQQEQEQETTPAAEAVYEQGVAAAGLDAVIRAPAEGRMVSTTYEMAPGDTLDSVARKFGVTAETIRDCNNIKNLDAAVPGTRLEIPDRDGLYYTVRSGDVLSTICSKFGLSMGYETLMEVNGLKSDQIWEGQRLFIPNESVVPSIAAAAEGMVFRHPLKGAVPFKGYRETWTDPATKKLSILDGILLKAPEGSEVRASAGGVATLMGDTGNLAGGVVKIAHDAGYCSYYFYLDWNSLKVASGDTVEAGDVLGTVTASSSPGDSPMLLFKIEQNGMALNPDLFF